MDRARHHRKSRRKDPRPQPRRRGDGLPNSPAGGAKLMARNYGRKSKVLVVDDERNVLLTYKMLLEQQGYETVASLTAKEAIALIEKQDFDLLLCDLSLEEKRTGFEVIKAARARRPVPAVLLTGYASPEAADYARENEVSVLYKPIEIDDFLKTIATLLKENHA